MEVDKIFIHDLKVGDIVKCKSGFSDKGNMSDPAYGGAGYRDGIEAEVTTIEEGSPFYPEKGRTIWFDGRGVYEIALERTEPANEYEIY